MSLPAKGGRMMFASSFIDTLSPTLSLKGEGVIGQAANSLYYRRAAAD